jgi:hypothetical protein
MFNKVFRTYTITYFTIYFDIIIVIIHTIFSYSVMAKQSNFLVDML